MQRGVCRALRMLGHSMVTELPLANGRRADVVSLSAAGDIASSKSNPASSTIDRRQMGGLSSLCDRLYFAVAADFPCEVIPAAVGLLLADRYGAELGARSGRRATFGRTA